MRAVLGTMGRVGRRVGRRWGIHHDPSVHTKGVNLRVNLRVDLRANASPQERLSAALSAVPDGRGLGLQVEVGWKAIRWIGAVVSSAVVDSAVVGSADRLPFHARRQRSVLALPQGGEPELALELCISHELKAPEPELALEMCISDELRAPAAAAYRASSLATAGRRGQSICWSVRWLDEAEEELRPAELLQKGTRRGRLRAHEAVQLLVETLCKCKLLSEDQRLVAPVTARRPFLGRRPRYSTRHRQEAWQVTQQRGEEAKESTACTSLEQRHGQRRGG